MINKYPWTAIFNNGDVIRQYDNDGNEVLFKKVLERKKELKKFIITNGADVYSVDLDNGIIKINEDIVNVTPNVKGARCKLIYCRKNIVEMSGDIENSRKIIHQIGLEFKGKEYIIEVN